MPKKQRVKVDGRQATLIFDSPPKKRTKRKTKASAGTKRKRAHHTKRQRQPRVARAAAAKKRAKTCAVHVKGYTRKCSPKSHKKRAAKVHYAGTAKSRKRAAHHTRRRSTVTGRFVKS